MKFFASDTEKVDYRATFKQCPDCGGMNFDTNFPKCVHCSDCAWVACMSIDSELEELARIKGITVHYEPITNGITQPSPDRTLLGDMITNPKKQRLLYRLLVDQKVAPDKGMSDEGLETHFEKLFP